MENECDIVKSYSQRLHVRFLPRTRELTWDFRRVYTDEWSFWVFKSRWFYVSLILQTRKPNSLTTVGSAVELEFEATSHVDPVGGSPVRGRAALSMRLALEEPRNSSQGKEEEGEAVAGGREAEVSWSLYWKRKSALWSVWYQEWWRELCT